MMSKLLVAAACLLVVVNADVYMQYPRGSNNRLNEANRGRQTDNRLFDSQNNNRGGYNVGNLYFYTGTTMNIEWTNQHSCGGPNNKCEMIIQYACDPKIRDGSTTTEIEPNPAHDGNPRFGRHESVDWYMNCRWRSRNKGLFTANRRLNGNGAIYTRQNNNGARSALECPEERDYYPYWHPTMWRDIAIITNEPSRCIAYQTTSQNVAERYFCDAPADWIAQKHEAGLTGFIPINATQCVAIKSLYQVDENNNTIRATWKYQAPWNIPAPDCTSSRFTRDNHLGNIASGYPASYNWTIPSDVISERCVLRLRYNISTSEYVAWDDGTVDPPANLTSANNSSPDNNAARDVALIDVYSKYGLQWTDVNVSYNRQTNDPNGAAIKRSRDYVLKNNPKVDIFGNDLISRGQSGDAQNSPSMIRLQLAINTNQFGRTFEDRSHRFAIRERPSELEGVRIHNLQVKGRRGNIVQNFPGTEYDFVPKRLQVQNGAYIHFQWTGSNNNGDNNAGRGKAGTDRHNVLLLRAPVYEYIQTIATQRDAVNMVPTIGQLGSTYPSDIDGANATFLGFSYQDLKTLAVWSPWQFGGDMDQGDDAGTYFDLGLRQVTANGIFNYACTRNNDFSNRDQKATIIVSSQAAAFRSFGAFGGTLTADSGATLTVDPDSLLPGGTYTFTLLTSPSDSDSSFSGSVNSDYVTLISDYRDPTDIYRLPLQAGKYVTLSIPYQNKPLVIPQMYRADTMQGPTWATVSASYSGGVATAQVDRGGVYVVQTQVNWGAVVGVIVGVVGFVGIVVGIMYYRFKKSQAGGTDTKMESKA